MVGKILCISLQSGRRVKGQRIKPVSQWSQLLPDAYWVHTIVSWIRKSIHLITYQRDDSCRSVSKGFITIRFLNRVWGIWIVCVKQSLPKRNCPVHRAWPELRSDCDSTWYTIVYLEVSVFYQICVQGFFTLYIDTLKVSELNVGHSSIRHIQHVRYLIRIPVAIKPCFSTNSKDLAWSLLIWYELIVHRKMTLCIKPIVGILKCVFDWTSSKNLNWEVTVYLILVI